MKKTVGSLIVAVMAVVLCCLLPAKALAAAVDLPQTSQTTCYDAAGTVIDCPGTGQDGDVRAGVAWPQPRFTDNNNGTLTDRLTGLVWLRHANCYGFMYWDDALTWAKTLAHGACGLTDGTAAGDWRLPNILELESLVNVDHKNESCSGIPCASPVAWLDSQGFSNIGLGYYFSSSTAAQAGHQMDAWTVDMDDGGDLIHGSKSSNYLALAVRGTSTGPAAVWRTGQAACYNSGGAQVDCAGTGQDGEIQAGAAWPVPRFTDSSDGTVTDNLTGLTWLKNANCAGTTRNWPTALADVASLNADGTMNGSLCNDTSNNGSHQNDWRLPNYKELLSLVDFARYSPAMPAPHPFDNVVAHYYWTSTTGVRNTATALFISFWDGYTLTWPKSITGYVWPVRGGTLPPPPPFAGGSGTAADPYQIETVAQLDAVRNYLDSHFILTADLDLDVAPYNEGEGWQPIGTYVGWENAANVPFTGSVDGNDHSIVGLSLDMPTAQGVGLFGLTDGATIRDLSLSNLSVTGRTAGGLTGWAFNTTITGVQTAGTITALTRASGLAGEVRGSTISDSGSACTVSTTNGTNAGGLIGQMEATTVARSHATGNVSSGTQDIAGGLVAEAGTNSVISESFATGAVSGRDEIGGLVGYLGSGSRVETSYALGQVIGNLSVGGLIGDLDKSTIAKAYARGAVIGATRVGGLVGWLQDAASAVDASYATGKVSGTTDLGGLIGLSNVAPTFSYYNSETSGQSDTGKGEPHTTAQMRQGMAYNPVETYVGWFAGTPAWAIGENFNGGYPYLHALPRFTVAAAITGSGSIQWIGEYPHGATAELRLVPATDFGINSAEGCGGTLTAPLFTTAPLTANCTVTGEFIEEFPWILFLPKKPADKK